MSILTNSADRARWSRSPEPAQLPEAGYDHWLAEEMESGPAELDRGEGVPAEKAWKTLRLE